MNRDDSSSQLKRLDDLLSTPALQALCATLCSMIPSLLGRLKRGVHHFINKEAHFVPALT